MSDTEAPAEATEQTEAPAPKADKTKPCYCSAFEVGKLDETIGTDAEEIFTTGCQQTTQRTFAQGHDARLVSFLVDGHFDGYNIRTVIDGVARTFASPGEAAATASESLGQKAQKATDNRAKKLASAQATKELREAKKAETKAKKEKAAEEKAALKAVAAESKKDAPKAAGAEVVAGSAEGDVPELPEGVVKIKVGRWEYDATIDGETGEASFIDGKGEPQTIERDGYRILQNA